MIHPHTEVRLIDDHIGLGVFANSFIPKGTIVWVQDPLDRVFSLQDIEHLAPPLKRSVLKYTFRNAEGKYIMCWDTTRFVNHSFLPNVMITPYDFDIATEDIPAGTELRGDYGCLNIVEAFEPYAEEGASRTVVKGDDLLHYHQAWDKVLANTFPFLVDVEQPLRELLSADKWTQISRIALGEEPLASVLTCYCSK